MAPLATCVAKHPSTLARCVATHLNELPGCAGMEMTNGSAIPRGVKTTEASRIFLHDTCLTEFDQGWVRGSQPPSGSKNWQRERTLVRWQADSSSLQTSIYGSLIPEIQGAGILYIAENCCWFEIEISALGALCFVGGEEGIPLLGGWCWIGTHLVVSPPEFCYYINKTIWVSPTCLCINDVLLYLHV